MRNLWLSTMRCLVIVILLIISTNTCDAGGKNGVPKMKSIFDYITNYQMKVKATKLQFKTQSIKHDFELLKIYLQLLAGFERKLDLCIRREKSMTTISEQPITSPDIITTKLPKTTTTEEYYEPTEKPGRTTEDYIEPTERPGMTTEDYFETTERPGMTTEDYFDPTKRPGMTTENYFEPTEMPGMTTENYYELTERPGMTTEEYFEPTEKPSMTTEDYYEPSEKPIMTTEDYPEITETPTEILSTIVDYPEDITNYRTLPPTEIPIETTTITMVPWIDITSSILTKPWWFTSERRTRSTRSNSTRHTHYHRTSTTRPRRTRRTRHTYYHRTLTKRTRPGRRTWTIKKFTVITGRWR